MYKVFIFIAALIFGLTTDNIAYARELNENELEIIEAAGKVYEYNGQSYKVDQQYIDKLVDYFSRDNVDITKDEKDVILQIADSSIETGIREGYLIPIEDQNSHNAQDTETHNKKETESQNESQSKSQNESYIIFQDEFHDEPLKENQNNTNNETDNIKTGDKTGRTEEEYLPNVDQNADNDNSNSASSGKDQKIFSCGTIDKISSLTDTDKAESMKDPAADTDNIIKNTGFSLNGTLYITLGLSFIALTAFIITLKNNYFRK